MRLDGEREGDYVLPCRSGCWRVLNGGPGKTSHGLGDYLQCVYNTIL